MDDPSAARLLKAAKGARVAAEAIRSCVPVREHKQIGDDDLHGMVLLSKERADLIASLLDDIACVFGEMSIAIGGNRG